MIGKTYLLGLICLSALAQIRFEDASASSGIGFVLRNGASGKHYLPELMPGGVAAFDFDGDNCTDLFFANGATLPSMKKAGPEHYNRLYKNDCKAHFTDVTARAGLAGEGFSIAAATADYDNDGHVDLFVAGVNRNTLYRNRGDGTFEDVTARAGLAGLHAKYGKLWSIAAGWFDADGDGFADLFVSSYVAWDPAAEPACGSPDARMYCHPDRYQPRPNQFFRNNGDGTFTDLTDASGIGAHAGKGMGVAFADYDRDGRPDIFVANDSMRNFLFHNLGGARFEETGLQAGVSLPEGGRAIAGMGVDFRDLDNDGMPDIVITGMINDTFLLFRNLGKPAFFEDNTAQSGLSRATRQLTGWGAGAFDLDNDGAKDLVFANAHFPQFGRLFGGADSLPLLVLRNDGSLRFRDVSSAAGSAFAVKANHRGVAFADFDNDGDVDIAVSVIDGPARLLKNTSAGPSNWIGFRLRGTDSTRSALGAEITITARNRSQTNHMSASVGYASSSDPVVRFGLGLSDRIDKVRIRWPRHGNAPPQTQELQPSGINRIIEVIEPCHTRCR